MRDSLLHISTIAVMLAAGFGFGGNLYAADAPNGKKPAPAPSSNCCPTPCPPKPCEPPCPVQTCCVKNPGEALCAGELKCAYNAPARVEVSCGWDFFGSASFLYWQPRQTKFYVATLDEVTPTPPANVPRFTHLVDFDYKYQPGFKLAAGYRLPYDNWVIAAEWTWLHATQTTSASADAPEHLEPWFIFPFTSGNATDVRNKWHYGFDIVDVALSRPFYSSTRFVMTPFVGGRLFFNHQHLNGRYTYNLATPPGSGPFFDETVHINVEAWELGPRIGTNGTWLVGSGFAFTGDVGFSVLYASFDMKYRQFGNNATQSTALNVSDSRTVDTFLPNMDMSFGLRWGTYINCNKQHIGFAAKYDFLYFWGNSMVTEYSALELNGQGDLTLQGLTLNANMDF